MTEPQQPASASSPPFGHVLRAMTDDGSFRVLTVEATELVREATATQRAFNLPAVQLGELLVAAVLIRETMAPAHRVQVLLRNKTDDLVVGDAFPEGRTRGLVRVQDDILGVRIHDGGYLQVTRTLPGRSPHEGVVELADDANFAESLRRYFLQSEQVETFTGIACTETETGEIARATGYIVQLLPELTDPPLEAMRTRLDRIGPLEDLADRVDGDPQRILDAILHGEAYTSLAASPVFYACGCGLEKARSAVAMLGAEEIESMIASGETSRIHCDYCRTLYELGTEDLRAVLERIRARGQDS